MAGYGPTSGGKHRAHGVLNFWAAKRRHGSPVTLKRVSLLNGNVPHTVLVLEPEPLLREQLRQALAAAGVERILHAHSRGDALLVLSSSLVDVVMTRWVVEDARGRKLIQELRNRGVNRRVPLVLLDDGLSRYIRVQAIKLGVAGRLTYPPSLEGVAHVLSAIADQKIGEDPPR